MASSASEKLRVSLDPEEAERTIVRFLRDYSADAGRPRFVVGLSGGLDSAVSAALGVKAVGAKNVFPLLLPDANTGKADLDDAARVAKWLRVKPSTQSIAPFVETFERGLARKDRAIAGNAKARFRMILLHSEAARRKALVLGTGNKSEALTGYFSKFGDGGVDVQPIGDLYKTQVRLLARHLGVPKRVIDKPPTAGLWANQTDEAELRITYEKLDRVLLGLEVRFPAKEIASAVGVSVGEVERIERLRKASQHKRRMPATTKLGLRTVGVDWRASVQEA